MAINKDVDNVLETLGVEGFNYLSFKDNEDKIKSAMRWPIYKEILIKMNEKADTKNSFRLQRLSTVKS